MDKRFFYWETQKLNMLAVEGQEKPKRHGQHRSRSMRRVAKFIRKRFSLVSKTKVHTICRISSPIKIFIVFDCGR